MRGLYIGVHSSCSFYPDPFEYMYIISVNIASFWSTTCSIGNVYVPVSANKMYREKAIVEIRKWLNTRKKDRPALLVGDFNMNKTQLSNVISNLSQHWRILEMEGPQYTRISGNHLSSIDFVIINDCMCEYIYKVSACNSFLNISDHLPLLLSCKKEDSEGFFTPSPSKTFKWSRKMCKSEGLNIEKHNYFTDLASDFLYNNLDSNEMISKFVQTSNKVGDDVKARIPSNLPGSVFHCPHFIKKLSHEKHLRYVKIKNFTINHDASNISEFLELTESYKIMCDTIKDIKKNIRKNLFLDSVKKVCDDFVNNNNRKGWQGLRKLSRPSFSSTSSPNYLKSSDGRYLFSNEDKLQRFAEHYEILASDVTGHSRDDIFWENRFASLPFNPEWDINGPITISEIYETVSSMKNNKAPGPDGIPTEFFKAFFTNFSSDDDQTNNQSSFSESNPPDSVLCLYLLFNKIWDGDFPSDWNTASIVSIPKKGDLSDCNNYRGISLINVSIKIITKIITNRITKYALQNNFIRPEQFGFRYKEECISLFISIREICQRRANTDAFTYLAFLDLKKAYDTVPIYNILTKLKHIGIRGKCLQFITELYKTSKARVSLNNKLSDEFEIFRGVRQGCPLSPILFNIFINSILDGCSNHGVQIGENSTCCGGLFADDIVLMAPSKKSLKRLLSHVNKWANENEMTFGINKCATMVVKPFNFTPSPNYSDPSFFLGIHKIPKTSSYKYLGIPFHDNLSLKPIISNLNTKLNLTLNSFYRFLHNKYIPLILKRRILSSHIVGTINYYAPLLGSNKQKTRKAQTILNRGLFWSLGHKNVNANTCTYTITCEFWFTPLSALCAIAQIRCFNKWKDSSCIIKELITNIPSMPHYYTWSKESRTLDKKLKGLSKKEIKMKYLERDTLTKKPAKRATIYIECKYGLSRDIQKLALKYPQYQIGFFWIMRIRSGYQFYYKILLNGKSTYEKFPTYCPCCGENTQSFSHWIFRCKAFEDYREFILGFTNELYSKIVEINRNKSLGISLDTDEDYEDNIYYLMLNVLLDGRYAFDKLKDVDQRHWHELLFKGSSESSDPFIVGLSHYLTLIMPIIFKSFYILVNWYNNCKISPGDHKGVDVEMIRQGIYSDTDAYASTSNGVTFAEWEKLEV